MMIATIFLLIIVSVSGLLRTMKEEEYQFICDIVRLGRCDIPVAERTREQKSAYIKYWRHKDKLTLDENGRLLYEGHVVLKEKDVKKCVAKAFHLSKSAGYKKIRTRALDGYAGLSRRNILQVTGNDPKYKKFTVKFTNKATPKPIVAKGVGQITFTFFLDN